MTKCNEEIYKLMKGDLIKTIPFSNSASCSPYIKLYELLITDTDGKTIAKVDQALVNYSETFSRSFLCFLFGDSLVHESLNSGGQKWHGYIKDLSVNLNEKGFVIKGNSGDSRMHVETRLAIEKGNITLTEHGEKVFSECFGNTLEYYAPTDDSTDHSFDQASCDKAEAESYSATNLDIL